MGIFWPKSFGNSSTCVLSSKNGSLFWMDIKYFTSQVLFAVRDFPLSESIYSSLKSKEEERKYRCTSL